MPVALTQRPSARIAWTCRDVAPFPSAFGCRLAGDQSRWRHSSASQRPLQSACYLGCAAQARPVLSLQELGDWTIRLSGEKVSWAQTALSLITGPRLHASSSLAR